MDRILARVEDFGKAMGASETSAIPSKASSTWPLVLAFFGGGFAIAAMALVNMGSSFGFANIAAADLIPPFSVGSVSAVIIGFFVQRSRTLALRQLEARHHQEAQSAQARILDAFNSIDGSFDLWDADDRLILSSAGKQRSDPKLGELSQPGKTFEEIVRAAVENGRIPEAKDQPEAWIQKRLAHHRGQKGSFEILNHEGRWIQFNEHRTHDGGTLIIRTDITGRKKAEENQTRFVQALDGVPEGIVLWDAEDRFVMTNERFHELQPTSSNLLRPGMTYENFVRERLKSGEINQAQGKENEWVAQRMKNHQQKFQDVEIQRHGRWLRVRENRLADGSTIQFYGDITERKQAEERLKDYATAAADRFWATDVEHRLIRLPDDSAVEGNLSDQIGIGKRRWELPGVNPDEPIWHEHREDLDNRRIFRDFRYTHLDDQEHPVYLRVNGVPYFENNGDFVGYRGTTTLETDYVEERQAHERQIMASLAEKEVMLQEIHHRVKNNFQVISSMLMLQANAEKDDHAHDALMIGNNRIMAMARVHEKLYGSPDLANISAKEYLESIVGSVMAGRGENLSGISCSFDIEDIILSGEQAIPCGLMVNELISNALEHGFSNRQSGSIEVSQHGAALRYRDCKRSARWKLSAATFRCRRSDPVDVSGHY